MAKIRFISTALDGQTVTLTATQGGETVGPETFPNWGNVVDMGGPWAGAGPATLTVTVDEVTSDGADFAPYPVEWRIRVTGTSYATPDWAIDSPTLPEHITDFMPFPDLNDQTKTTEEGVYRLALEEHDPSFQRCQFVVLTGDTGNYRNEWVGSASHRDKAYQYGQNCGHVYDAPGTYTGRSIFVYDDEGNWGALTLPDLTVVSADTVFDAASTIVVDPLANVGVAGDWVDAPAHDVANRCTSMNAAAIRFNNLRNDAATTAGMRICIKAGSSFVERSRGFDSGDAKGVCLVDTYGGSERFTYSERNLDIAVTTYQDQLFILNTGSDKGGWAWRICNGEFDFGYDVAQGRPTNPDGWTGGNATLCRSLFKQDFAADIFDRDTRVGDPFCRVVIHNCDITGCAWFAINCLDSNLIGSRDAALYLNDVEIYDNADYSTYGPVSLFALGVKQYDTAAGARDIGGVQRSATMGTSRGWTGHSIFIREQTIYCLYVRATYLENRGAWSGGGYFGFRGSQPQFRLRNASETSFKVQPDGWMVGRGARQFICDSVIVGYFGFGAGDNFRASNDPTQTLDLRHTVLENCLIIHDPQSGSTGPLSDVQARGSVRNCMFLCLESPDVSISVNSVGQIAGRDITRFTTGDNRSGQFDYFVQTSGNILKNGNRLELRHNSYIMLRTTSEIVDGVWNVRQGNQNWDEADFELVEGHNITSAPRLNVPEGLSEAQLDTINLPDGMRVLDAWVKFYWERLDFTLGSTVAAGTDTPAILYPIDWYSNPTTGADYADSGKNNAILSTNLMLDYDTKTTDFVAGETVTGEPDEVTLISATATIESVTVKSGTTGRLAVKDVVGTFVENETLTSASGSARANFDPPLNNPRYFEPSDNYPNSNGVQAQTENAGKITVIHDCNSSGVVQGDGTGTHFKITNNTGADWPAGPMEIILDRSGSGQMVEDVLTTIDQNDLKLYRPTTPQALDNGVPSTLWDFNRTLRPNAGYAISPSSGTNAAGAILPA